MKSWLLAFRPKTLTAALVPILVGTALTYSHQVPWPWWVTLCALFSALFIQIATNLLNDAIDFKKGADREDRLGPVRVTQSGLISGRRVFGVGIACLIIALLLGVPLALRGGWPIVIVGVFSLFLAYSYTGGPFPLAYLGLGDLFVLLFFGIIAVCGIYYLHTLLLSWDALVAGIQVGLLATVLIAVNNFRDSNQDERAGKKTLAVRFGQRFVRFEILALIGMTYLLNIYWFMRGDVAAAVFPLLFFPLGVKLIRDIFSHEPSGIYNGFLARSALLHLGFGVLFSVGLILG